MKSATRMPRHVVGETPSHMGNREERRKGPGHALEAALGSWAAAARPALRKAGREQQRAPGKRP